MPHFSTPFAEIAAGEYLLRVERLRAGMRAWGVDAILLGTGMNLQYFSGYPSPARSVTRPFFLLVPANAGPILLTHTAFAEECRHIKQVHQVQTYETLSQVPIEALTSGLPVRFGKIGMELGYEQSLDISQLEFKKLQQALSPAELIDVSPLLWKLRMIKSETEIDCMRHACALVARAYESTFRNSHAAMNEKAISRLMQEQLSHAEGDNFLVVTSGEGNYDMISKGAWDRIVQEGEMVWMDAGCRVEGYWSDFSRAAVAGEPSEIQVRAQAAIAGITASTIEQIRPGVKCSDVARFVLTRLEELDFPITSSLSRRAARIGHGIGLTMTEPPHLGLHDDTRLEPGMVVSVEPGVATRFGTFHVEENVVVRDGCCQVLSNSPRELQRLA